MSTSERSPVDRTVFCIRLWPLVLGLGLTPAWAERPLWEFGLGLGLLSLPHYRGSDQQHSWLLPTPYFVYHGKILRADRDGARALLFDSERVDMDISLAATAPTRSRDNVARQGMPDLKATLELGPNVNLLLDRGESWKLQLRLPVRAAITLESHPQAIGWLATPNLNIDWRVHGWNVGLLGGPVFATRQFHSYFYDVAPPYATAARPAYQASGGASGWRVISGVSRRVGEWWLGAFATGSSVAGARFEPSPLVRQRNNLSFGIAFSWVFAASSQQVPSED